MFIVTITLSYFTFIETKKLSNKYKNLWYGAYRKSKAFSIRDYCVKK